MKAGEITKTRANALMDLKMEEVTAELTKANREIADNYKRSASRGRSFTCTTTTSSNLAFTTCN